MLTNYIDKISVNVTDLLDYLYAIDGDYNQHFNHCRTLKAIKDVVYADESYFLFLGLAHLQNVKNFEDLENHLVMMNYLFGEQPIYHQEKVALKKKIMKLNDPINQYRVLRHIMLMSPQTLIENLYNGHYINAEQAAYFNLVEENTDEAYRYLTMMDHEASDALLDLFASYAPVNYLRLLAYYDKMAQHHYQVRYS